MVSTGNHPPWCPNYSGSWIIAIYPDIFVIWDGFTTNNVIIADSTLVLKSLQYWLVFQTRPYLVVEAIAYKQRVKWFRQFMKHVMKELGVEVALDQCRPHSTVVHFCPARRCHGTAGHCRLPIVGLSLRSQAHVSETPRPCARCLLPCNAGIWCWLTRWVWT